MAYGIVMTDAELNQYVLQLEQKFQPGLVPQDGFKIFKKVGEKFLEKAIAVKPVIADVANLSEFIFNRTLSRALFSVGCELILKATYLKSGYVINNPVRGEWQPRLMGSVSSAEINAAKTAKFYLLIRHALVLFPSLAPEEVNGHIKKGLHIARIWRNKDIHIVMKHMETGEQQDEIENSLLTIYDTVFDELLTMKNILGIK